MEIICLLGLNFIKKGKNMFAINWLFDKLGYMPKIKVEVGALAAWPFPAGSEDFEPRPEKKMIVPKATTRKPRATKKPAVVAKTARTKKSK